ncbi:MAG: helix-turn-helix domain-containing protein [Lachnospiraceae bacterium]|nr:helix-turn-helix domain-containing protein [Lachnospiraceae bacterium]MDD6451833.1 helix-turn-helix domain-containing protein [Lachnospiraceae bacterium]
MITKDKNLLRVCRENLRLTQEEVAEAVHVTPKSIYRYENGLGYPNLVTALRISELFGKSVNELFPRSIQ